MKALNEKEPILREIAHRLLQLLTGSNLENDYGIWLEHVKGIPRDCVNWDWIIDE